jgi:hypothetical protein
MRSSWIGYGEGYGKSNDAGVGIEPVAPCSSLVPVENGFLDMAYHAPTALGTIVMGDEAANGVDMKWST